MRGLSGIVSVCLDAGSVSVEEKYTHVNQTIIVVLVMIPVGGHVAVVHPDIGGIF